jgi:hypothetical protein
MSLLTYQRKTLHAHINTWLGTLLLGSFALWAGLVIWQTAAGENAIVKAFSKVIEQRTQLPR